jgi:predicted nucleic acid-binding protein
VSVLVDTSALFAVLSTRDMHHEAAREWFVSAGSDLERLVTHNYVVLESSALVRSRLGTGAMRTLFEEVLPVAEVVFVDESMHRAAVASCLANPGGPSLVDRVSFLVMRDRGVRRAFAFDKDFGRAGFETVP